MSVWVAANNGNLWRGSLSDRRTVPLDCAAVHFRGRFATQREQAPSPLSPTLSLNWPRLADV